MSVRCEHPVTTEGSCLRLPRAAHDTKAAIAFRARCLGRRPGHARAAHVSAEALAKAEAPPLRTWGVDNAS
jgi:hypothetical protein